MKETPDKIPSDRELSLAEILQIIVDHRFRIVAVTVAVGILASFYMLLKPNLYQSSSALVVRPPEIRLTGEAAPLEPEMLVALTNSTEVKRAVFDIASASKLVEAGADFRHFQQNLETSIEARRGPTRELLPMIELHARTADPVKAKDLANLWARVAVEKSGEIYVRGIAEQSDFVGAFFESLESARAAAEAELATKTLEANLDLKNAQLTTQMQTQVALDKEIFEMEQKLKSNRALIQELRRRHAGQEREGMWIGDFLERQLMAGVDLLAASVSAPSATVAETVSRVLNNEKRFYEFLTQSAYFLKRSKLENWVEQMGLVNRELSAASKELVVKKNRFHALAVQSATLTPTFTLTKSVTDDILLQEFLDKREAGLDSLPSLKSEFENPNYYEFQKQLIEASVDYFTIQEQVADLLRRQERLSERVADASAELALITREKAIQESAIAQDRALLDFMKADYKKEIQEVQTLEFEQVRLKNDIALKTENAAAMDFTRAALAKEVISSSHELGQLRRRLENMETIAETLAAQSAEMQLLKSSVQAGARTGGITILYGAEVNPQRVGPRRTRAVCIAMAAAALFSSVYFVGRRLVYST